MVNHLCRNLVPWINCAILVILVVPFLVGFLGFGYLFFSIFITSTILILSTIFFKFSKPKPCDLTENSSEKDHVLTSPDQKIPFPQLEDHVKEVPDDHENESQEHQDMSSHVSVSSQNSLSELSDQCLDHSSITEDSEAEWPFRDNISAGRKTAVFSDDDDGSISDEESLIEIALPSGHYVGHDHDGYLNKEKLVFNVNQKMPADLNNLFPECIFKQRSLMELLAEINDMNEEENLIEIDISMGSIKCSRFEIEA
ncbi:uncharacterized protein LOC21397406 [Morus notabilis]|uniref:uncharacterized protein LOC21397406 n=1 Tax=Morus notabilis TaxID=981085 RepID=UPI000CED5342|nr:uncharacterized protein LOC21397406 [Morus notabilis]